MNFIKVLLSIGLALTVSQSMAQQKKQKPLIKKVDESMSGQGYGMAGCGLGSVVFGNEPGFVQIFANTLNGTSGNQTFGLTTGTSNCGERNKLVQADQFIETNKVALENDMSRGQGETLSSLAAVLECNNQSFGSDVKQRYSALKSSSNQVSDEQIRSITFSACNI